MINILRIKSEIGNKVTLSEVMAMYPEMKKQEISKALKNAGWISKVVWNEDHTKSSRKWCEPTTSEQAERGAKGLAKGATLYDVMIKAMEYGIDPTHMLDKLAELEAERDSRPETEFQEAVSLQRSLMARAIQSNKQAGPQYELGPKIIKFFKSAIMVYLVDNIYPQLEDKQTYKNNVATIDKLASELWDQYLHNRLGRFYASPWDPTNREVVFWLRERYAKKYGTADKKLDT